MGSQPRLRDHAKHCFAKLLTAQEAIPATLLVCAVGIGAPVALTHETPDNLTTAQTETLVEEIRSDLAIFREEYRFIKYLETTPDHNSMSPAAFEERQQQRLETVNKFHSDVKPVLERILFDGNLSEQQAQELMREFSDNIKPPHQIAEHLHIRDFGHLREDRNRAMQNPENSTVEDILTAASLKNDTQYCGKILLSVLFGLILSMGYITNIGESRTLRRLAQEKPKRPPRFKH